MSLNMTNDINNLRSQEKHHQSNLKRELKILKFMLKNDVLYYHHDRQDSMKKAILLAIDKIKQKSQYEEYNSYIWNYLGQGNDYAPFSWLGCRFLSPDFKTIYDVPLDGTYKFHIYDSGQRGLGSFNILTTTKVEDVPNVPKVNPGALPQIILWP